jgi:hypothetical protein
MAHAGEADPSANPFNEFAPETFRGTEGFFRAAQDGAGRWWLIDPDGRPFFCRAVHGVRAPVANGVGGEAGNAIDPALRLRRWGFNTVGVGGDGAGRDDGLAFLMAVDFCRVGAPILAPGVRLPDVFDPDWVRLAGQRAVERCGPWAACRELLGWLADDEPGWGRPRAAAAPRPTLLQVCLSLEPGFAAYHAAWEFTLALHRGRLESLARAWGVPIANKEIVRELTRAEQGLATRGYLRDDERWTKEFARRYFGSTAAAIRAADPNHLLFGCRFGGPVAESVRVECVYPAVDVPLLDGSELPPTGLIVTGPVLADGVCWVDERISGQSVGLEPTSATVGGVRRLTSVERMLRRGRGALARMARHPAAVGYVWRQWLDEPGEQPPFARGLVHLNGAEAREHTELLADFNARADTVRRTATESIFS